MPEGSTKFRNFSAVFLLSAASPGRARIHRKGIRIHAPITDGKKVVRIKPTYVFDISQTDELPQAAAA